MKGFLDAFFDSISSIFRIFDLSYFLTGSVGVLLFLHFYGQMLLESELINYVIDREPLLTVILIFCSYLAGIILMGVGIGFRKLVRQRKYIKQKQDNIDQQIYTCLRSVLLSTDPSERRNIKFNIKLIDLNGERIPTIYAVPTP